MLRRCRITRHRNRGLPLEDSSGDCGTPRSWVTLPSSLRAIMAASTDNVLHIPLTSNPDEAVQVSLPIACASIHQYFSSAPRELSRRRSLCFPTSFSLLQARDPICSVPCVDFRSACFSAFGSPPSFDSPSIHPSTFLPSSTPKVPLDALPQDISDVTDILVMEAAPLSLWDDFAVSFPLHLWICGVMCLALLSSSPSLLPRGSHRLNTTSEVISGASSRFSAEPWKRTLCPSTITRSH